MQVGKGRERERGERNKEEGEKKKEKETKGYDNGGKNEKGGI